MMTRVEELQKSYPTLPREFIVKWDVMSQGIKDTEEIDKVSSWYGGGSYQSRDHGITLKEIADKRPGTVRPGYVLRPKSFYMKSGLGARFARSRTSPYQIREIGDSQFSLFEGEEKIEDIYFVSPEWWGDDRVTSKGTRASTLVSVLGSCVKMQPVRFCEYFTRGEQCKFCNYNSTYEDAHAVGGTSPITLSLEDTVEAYTMLASEVKLIESRWQSGALRGSEQEEAMYLKFVERIAGAASYPVNMTLSTQPFDRKGLQRFKDAGLSCINMNVEVWGAEMFESVCPGKAKHRGFDQYLQAYLLAVEIFGIGNVGCNFVAGASLMARNGHSTWQEARDSLIEGFRWLMKSGVFPALIPLRLGAGSVYGDDKSSWEKVPPTSLFLELGMAHHEIMMEYGLYDKLNKLLFCPLDCQDAQYCGDLGMLAIAGDVGHWADSVFPEGTNWLAEFISSVNTNEPR